jgi:NTP pyrophosphatase (non-canonical NTP hydrolase)
MISVSLSTGLKQALPGRLGNRFDSLPSSLLHEFMPGIDLLLATTARLRAPDGCPWDREQTHRSVCDCLVEEVAELVEAIDRDDVANLREELGDLLFHVAMHAQMAAEAGKFTFDDVAREVNEKMVPPPSACLRRRRQAWVPLTRSSLSGSRSN